jgi:protoporphyrinogen oxidase
MLFKTRERRKELPRSFTLSGGMQTLADVLLDAPKITLVLNAEVTSIERAGEGFSVRFSDGSERRSRFLALAAPPSIGAELLRPSFPEVAEGLSRILVTPIHSIGVVVRTDAVPIAAAAGIIPLDGRFYSAVSRDTVPDPTWRAFAFHFKPEVGRDQGLSQISHVLQVDSSKFEHVVERQVVLPSPRLGHGSIVSAIDQAIAQTPLFVTGNYFGGLAIEDCVLRSFVESARLLRAAGAAV